MNKNTSPNIDRIAKRGALFSNAFSTINSTDPSFTTIFTGKHPLSHGLRHHAKMVTATEKSYTTNLKFLPEILKDHDFTTDPIMTVIDGDWVKAEGTTLGADNGIGVAAIMAVLSSKDIEHGPVGRFQGLIGIGFKDQRRTRLPLIKRP